LGLVPRFRRDRGGNVAIIFALSVIPVLLVVGSAVDLSRAYIVKSRLGEALDHAALAVGSNHYLTQAQMTVIANDYFNANYPADELGAPGALNLSFTSSSVTITAQANLKTTFMALAGMDNITVASLSEVSLDQQSLEVALVLDNTGSMASGGRLNSLKYAAKTFIDMLYVNPAVSAGIKVSLVPFSGSVNIGSGNTAWMDTAANSSIHGENFTGSTNIFTLYNNITNRSWNGCVEARPSPLDVSDTPPTSGDSKWVPYFWPDEPDTGAPYWYSYAPDGIAGTPQVRQSYPGKYAGLTISGSYDPSLGCRIQPITPLSNSKNALKNSIDAMTAHGTTVIPIGLAWGWRTISPGAPFTTGKAYSDKANTKAIILLTDGENDIAAIPNHNKSAYSGYGYIGMGRLGTTDHATAMAELNTRTQTVCNNIKAKNILLYTITFHANSSTIQNLMRGCASEPHKYFDSPSNADLDKIFKEIAKDLLNVRISK
jgi:Flp pilus assembly protein TadG